MKTGDVKMETLSWHCDSVEGRPEVEEAGIRPREGLGAVKMPIILARCLRHHKPCSPTLLDGWTQITLVTLES